MSILDYICHRKPERNLFIKGHQFPVCARGIGSTALIIYLIYISIDTYIPTFEMFILGIILLIPCGIDETTQFLDIEKNIH